MGSPQNQQERQMNLGPDGYAKIGDFGQMTRYILIMVQEINYRLQHSL